MYIRFQLGILMFFLKLRKTLLCCSIIVLLLNCGSWSPSAAPSVFYKDSTDMEYHFLIRFCSCSILFIIQLLFYCSVKIVNGIKKIYYFILNQYKKLLVNLWLGTIYKLSLYSVMSFLALK